MNLNNKSQLKTTIKLFLFLNLFIFSLILFLRPDIHYSQFYKDKIFWILPLVLIFLSLNYKSIFIKILNRLLVFSILALIATQIFPEQFKSFQSYLPNYKPYIYSTQQYLNNLLTPKDGTPPKFQFDLIDKPTVIDSIKNIYNGNITSKNISESISSTLPNEVKNKLENSGIEITNPIKTLENLSDKKSTKESDSFLK